MKVFKNKFDHLVLNESITTKIPQQMNDISFIQKSSQNFNNDKIKLIENFKK